MKYLTRKLGDVIDCENVAKIVLLDLRKEHITVGVLSCDELEQEKTFNQINGIIKETFKFCVYSKDC